MSGGSPSQVTVAILAGGLGTRLRPAVADRPKVLARVLDRPFLARLLDQVADAGFERVVLCTGYRAEQIEAEFGASYRGVSLSYSPETEPLGTGGALRLALPLLQTGTVLVMNGDSYCDADLNGFLDQHQAAGARGSILLVRVQDAGRYGQVELSPAAKIVSFREKQPNAPAGWVNAGLYLLNRDLVAAIPAGRPVSLERECFPSWLGLPLQGVATGGCFLDIGTPESYRAAEEFFGGLSGRAPAAAAARSSTMNIKDSTVIPGLKVITPEVFHDFRGEYVETYNARTYKFQDLAGRPVEFVEDDISMSRQNVLRGLHGDQKTWKLIQCLWGAFYYVVADMRRSSPGYLKWECFTLSDRNRTQVLVPAGCANGHLVLSEQCIFSYKQSQHYSGMSQQFTVRWNDPALGVYWPVREPVLSQRDSGAVDWT